MRQGANEDRATVVAGHRLAEPAAKANAPQERKNRPLHKLSAGGRTVGKDVLTEWRPARLATAGVLESSHTQYSTVAWSCFAGVTTK